MSHTALEMLEGSSAENEIEFKCGICSKKCRVPQDRAARGKIAYFKSSKCKSFILVWSERLKSPWFKIVFV